MPQPSPGRKTGNKPLLVAVWGLETGDHGYFDVFYPARRVREACERAGVSCRFAFPSELDSFLDAPGTNPETAVFLVRGSAGPAVAGAIETAGFRAVNASGPLVLALDKLETARFLERNGWPTPRTVAFDPPPARGASPVDVSLPFPAVLKPRFGSRGRGVTLVETERALGAALETEFGESLAAPRDEPPPEEYVLQEYVRSSRGRDVRFFFAGDRVLAVAERVAPEGALVSNASRGGALRVPPWAEGPAGKAALERWSAQTLDIARACGLLYGSVDYLYERDAHDGVSLTVCEINGSPGFEALERSLGVDVAFPLVSSILADLGWRGLARSVGD